MKALFSIFCSKLLILQGNFFEFLFAFFIFIACLSAAYASDDRPPYSPQSGYFRQDFRSDAQQQAPTSPQVAPNIALAPNAADRDQINQLFDAKKARYKGLRKYSLLKLFPIPTREDKSKEK